MSKIQNEMTEVPTGIEMNDENYMKDVLNTLKALSTTMGTFATEASHDDLSFKIDSMIGDLKMSQRKIFELLFANGWYTLEEAPKSKIDEKYTELSKKYDDLE